MGRKVWLGIALIAGIVTPSAWPEAAAGTKSGDVTFTQGWVNDQPTLRVEGRGVKFFKRVGRDRVSIRVEVAGDVVELEAEVAGKVHLSRQGKSVAFRTGDTFDASIARIQKLTAGSKALDGFEGLVRSIAGSDSPHAPSLRSSHALLSALRGVTVPATLTPATSGARVVATRAATTATREGPFACWAEFASTMNQYLYEYSACLEDYWWIPGWTAACAFQFALQGELAWFWLISCSGGMPV